MNSLRTTKMYQNLDKIFEISPSLASINQWMFKYTVDRDKYDYLVQICKTFKFPLVKNVVAALERNEVIPCLLEDPKNVDDKLRRIPTSLSSMSTIDPKSKKIITFVDMSAKGKYIRNNTTKEIEAFTAGDERYFYCYAQRGYIARFLFNNGKSLDTTPKFVKSVVNSFGRMIEKPISALYGTGAKEQWVQKLLYISFVYALQNFFEYDTLKAKEFALGMPGISKSYIMNNCKFYSINNPAIDMRSTIDPKSRVKEGEEPKYPIDIFFEILKFEFEEMREGKIEYRQVFDRYVSMYGQNSLLTIEHCESFVNMMLSVDLKCGIYNDLTVYNIVKDDAKTIFSIISSTK